MVERRHMRRVSPILLVTLSLGCFFATYNLIVMVRHNRASIPRKVVPGGLDWLDPVTGMPEDMESTNVRNVKYHVALTATDAPYSKWQCRVMYYWYKKVKDMPGSDMGGFTRVLHSGKPDNLMDEIPTVIVDPLPEGLDRGYIVLNRPWAFVQWLEKATIEEEYILMAEPDHIFVKPLPNLAYGDLPVAFPFFYIKPSENEKIIRKYYPAEKGPVTDIDPIGNSPVIIKKSVLENIAPTWMNVSMRMKDDAETDKAFGWVLEMYGYAVASALHGVRHSLRKDFMIQPPWDTEVGKSFIIHYTYGCDYDKDVVWIKKCVGTVSARVVTNLGKDTFTPSVCRIAGQFHSLIAGQFQSGDGKLTYGKIGEWRFDKRTYLTGPPPRNLTLPPPGVPESVVELVKKVNEATANIPGWDSS